MTEERKQEALDRLSEYYVKNLSKAIRRRMRVELQMLEEHRTREEKEMNNRDDILRMAREAGLEVVHFTSTPEKIERFAALVAAAEREACAKVCDEIEEGYHRREGKKRPEARSDAETGAGQCAAAIRAMKQEPPR